MHAIPAPTEFDSYRIINMLRRVFEYIDPRLIQHGERVAFLADKLYTSLPDYSEEARPTLLVLSLLHDIGAYKTEEIDDMLRFETQNVWPHAIYGYLFLQMTTRLGSSAEAILYHHSPWDAVPDTNMQNKRFAAAIHLADRIDVLTQGNPSSTLACIRENADHAFYPPYVDAFFRLNTEQGLVAALMDGGYADSVNAAVQALAISDDEIDEYLRMIVYAIDFRSPFTVTHTANTSSISSELGKLFKLPEEEQAALETGAFLHDIGKICVPTEILESPGKLSSEEMALMRTHVVKTGDIICGFVDAKICRIAGRHHEKLNGSGYPDGLTAEDLTLPERIVAVADVLSALINRRSYKEPFPREQAVAIIAKMRDDGELCPDVCNMLLNNYDGVMQSVAERIDPVVSQYEALKRTYDTMRARLEAIPE